MDEIHAWHESYFFVHVYSGIISYYFPIGDIAFYQKIKGMKVQCFLALLLFPTLLIGRKHYCDSVRWNANSKLGWIDFKGTADRMNTNDTALSSINIYYKADKFRNTVKFYSVCYFLPCESWAKKKNDYYLLLHEQIHFDIGEYWRRILVKKVSSQYFAENNFEAVIKKLGEETNKERNAMNEEYDMQTERSQNKIQQEAWAKKINKLLQAEEGYSKSIILFSVH
jgi:hypothetical protein